MGILDGESLDLVLQSADGAGKLAALVGGDGGSNDGAGDTTGTAKGGLGLDVNVGDVLVLSQERQVKNNAEGVGIRGEENKLGNTTVEGLGGLVGCKEKVSSCSVEAKEVTQLVASERQEESRE